MSSPKVNPINFRLPVQVDSSVHQSVHQAFQDHDNAIVDLQQAIAALKSQLNTSAKAK